MYLGICQDQKPVTLAALENTFGVMAPNAMIFKRPLGARHWEMANFGAQKDSGDRIGFLLEFRKDGTGELTLFKNGACLGPPLDGIEPGTYYPCASMVHDNKVTFCHEGVNKPVRPFRNISPDQLHSSQGLFRDQEEE